MTGNKMSRTRRTSGGAWLRHWRLLFMKQVFPRLPRPARPMGRPSACGQPTKEVQDTQLPHDRILPVLLLWDDESCTVLAAQKQCIWHSWHTH